jgi:hypothetical protein
MGQHPLQMLSPAALPFLSLEPADPAILADGELSLADRPGEFAGGIKFPHLLSFDQVNEERFDSVKFLFNVHHSISKKAGLGAPARVTSGLAPLRVKEPIQETLDKPLHQSHSPFCYSRQ